MCDHPPPHIPPPKAYDLGIPSVPHSVLESQSHPTAPAGGALPSAESFLQDAQAGAVLWLWVEEGNSLASSPGTLKIPVALVLTFTGRLSSNAVHNTDNE